jgi:hypothetical protein
VDPITTFPIDPETPHLRYDAKIKSIHDRKFPRTARTALTLHWQPLAKDRLFDLRDRQAGHIAISAISNVRIRVGLAFRQHVGGNSDSLSMPFGCWGNRGGLAGQTGAEAK